MKDIHPTLIEDIDESTGLLEDPIYDKEEEALDYYRVRAMPSGRLKLIIGDNEGWGIQKEFTPSQALEIAHVLIYHVALRLDLGQLDTMLEILPLMNELRTSA